MSCRVLKRGMVNFVLNHLIEFSMKNKYEVIIGEYLQTSKNGLVKNHYSDLGFKKQDDHWVLLTKSHDKLNTYIKN